MLIFSRLKISRTQKELAMSKLFRISVLLISALACQLTAQTALAEYPLIVTADVDGDGLPDNVYNAGVIRVIHGNGTQRDYSLGNVVSTFYSAVDFDGYGGVELVFRAGPDVAIINDNSHSINRYAFGNIVFSIADAKQLDTNPGNEIIVKTGAVVSVITSNSSQIKSIAGGAASVWQYNGAVSLANVPYKTIVINTGAGLKLYNYNNDSEASYKNTVGPTSYFGVAEVNGVIGNELIGRTQSSVFVMTGLVPGTTSKTYAAGNGLNWAIYGSTADTDGKPGNEIILIEQGAIRIIHQSTGLISKYQISGKNYSINSVVNTDGVAGAEISVTNSDSKMFLINDRLGTIK